jgi:hypothetical protein
VECLTGWQQTRRILSRLVAHFGVSKLLHRSFH